MRLLYGALSVIVVALPVSCGGSVDNSVVSGADATTSDTAIDDPAETEGDVAPETLADSGPKPPGFECSGVAPIATLDPLALTGAVVDLKGGRISDARVAAATVSGSMLAEAVSGPTGAFRLELATGKKPLDFVLTVTKTGNVDFVLPMFQYAKPTSVGVPSVPPSDVDGLAGSVGAMRAPDRAFVTVQVVDCAAKDVKPLSDVSVTITPPPEKRGIFGNLIVAENISPGTVSVSATYQGVSLRPATIVARAGAWTSVTLAP
jgi:hypothetical protein